MPKFVRACREDVEDELYKGAQGTYQDCTVGKFWLIGHIHGLRLIHEASVHYVKLDRCARPGLELCMPLLQDLQRGLDIRKAISDIGSKRERDSVHSLARDFEAVTDGLEQGYQI